MTSRSPFQRFMAELRRRHVPQTLAVYLVAGWAAIEFADVVVPNLGWPQGVVTAVIIAAAVGLPVVVALAWFLEWTSEGVHRTPPPPPETPRAEPGGARPVEPDGSYTPWAVALGVLSLGIAGALVVVALDGRGEAPGAGTADDEPRTRSERRQSIRDSMLIPPIPPSIVGPGFRDSLARATSDSIMGAMEGQGFDPERLGPLIEMARRIGEATGRMAADGPVEIIEPDTWRYGAPHPVHPGDTLAVRGVARGEQGVVSVEVEGRVVARAGSREGALELPFTATIVAGEGRGFRRVPLVVRYADGEPLRRDFSLTLVPREGDDDGTSAPDGTGR